MAFNMWRDYLGLNATLKDMPGDASMPADPATPASSQKRPEMAAAAVVTCGVSGPPAADSSPASTSCTFCKHNGEAPSLYSSHSLKDGTGKVQCPVLRSYVCPQCGATGDWAHTRRFCPLTKDTYTSVYHHVSRKPEGKHKKK